MELQEVRKNIDGIDEKMLELFSKRMELTKMSAQCQTPESIALQSCKRDREILSRISKNGQIDKYTHKFFTSIFEISRSYQDSLTRFSSRVREQVEAALANEAGEFPETGIIACQGVEGSYSQMASDYLFPRGNVLFFKTFEAVFDAVESGLCQFGVLPIENSSNGSVRATYELLQKKDVSIVRSTRLCIRHELLAKPGTKLSDITEIHSHEQAIGQCGKFLKSLPAEVKIIPCDNTALAAEMAAKSENPGVASISSHNCGRLYGLEPVCADVQDNGNNYTRFICIKKEPTIYPGADHISLILALEHRPGSLYETLAKFSALGINLIKLESCPIAGHDFEFMFFFELKANVRDLDTLSMLESLERSSESFHFLGNYSEV